MIRPLHQGSLSLSLFLRRSRRCSISFSPVTSIIMKMKLMTFKTKTYRVRGLYMSTYLIISIPPLGSCFWELISDLSSTNITSCRDKPLFSLPNSVAKHPQSVECRVYHHLPWRRTIFVGPIPFFYVFFVV